MKKIIFNIVAVFILGLFFTSCEKWDEYENPELAGAPEVTLSLVSVQDSSATVSINTTTPGYVSLVITDDTTLTAADIDKELLLIGNVIGIEDQLFEVENASEAIVYSFNSGLIQNQWYRVFAVASNSDGVYSSVKELELMTDDTYAPYLIGTSPSKSTEAEQENDFSVELEFSEPVQLGENPVFKFSYYFDDEEQVVDAEDISVDGNIVTVSQSKVPYNGEWVFLSWEEGAVTDYLAGTPNKVDAQTSGVVDGALAGLYWRVAHEPFEINESRFTPEVGSGTDPQFNIEYNFPYAVSFPVDGDGAPVYEEGDVSVTFWKEGKKVVLDIPFDSLAIQDDTILVVNLTEAAGIGDWVSVDFAEGIVVDMYDNPNAAFESGSESGAYWLISYGYTRDLVLGSYTFSGISYWEGSDESFDVEIVADPEDESKVIINGFYGSSTPIPATFDGDFGTLTVSAEEDYLLGDLFDDGGETFFWSYEEDKFVINISSDGNMVTDPYYWLALYWVAADESDEGWVNIFTESTWTKLEGTEAGASIEKSAQAKKRVQRGIPRNGITKNN